MDGKLATLSVKSESAILVNSETGAVLYEKNSRNPLYPASITKIATAAYALKERGDRLDKLIVAEHDAVVSISEAEMERSNYTHPSYWLIPGASHMGIKRGEQLSLKDLLYGTLVASGGDSANVIANYIGGTIPTFMKLLNGYLQEIGCTETVFKNPHGLHHPGHVTSARDMALLTREAMKNPVFCEIVKSVRCARPQTNKQMASTLVQTNRLLKRGKYYYPKAVGVKTGYTSKAQHTLVAAAKHGDRVLIAVLMKCKERDDILSDAIKLFEEAFKEEKINKQLLVKGLQKPVLNLPNASLPIKTYTKESLSTDYYPSEMPTFKCLLLWDKVSLPIKKDQPLGLLSFQDERGSILAERALLALEDVDYSASYRVKNFMFKSFWGKFLLGIFGIFLLSWCLRRLLN